MQRDERVRQGYINLTISFMANAVIALSWYFGIFKGGVCMGYFIFGIAKVFLSPRHLLSLISGVGAIVLGVIMVFPVSGIVVPYHPILLRVYNPRIQFVGYIGGMIILLLCLGRDIMGNVMIKMDQWNKVKKEKEEREQKMRGIFYTPIKPKGGAQNTVFRFKQNNGHIKSQG
jgi:hypothetical protein